MSRKHFFSTIQKNRCRILFKSIHLYHNSLNWVSVFSPYFEDILILFNKFYARNLFQIMKHINDIHFTSRQCIPTIQQNRIIYNKLRIILPLHDFDYILQRCHIKIQTISTPCFHSIQIYRTSNVTLARTAIIGCTFPRF